MRILVLGAGYVGLEVAKEFSKNSENEVLASTTTLDKVSQLQTFCSQAFVLHSSDHDYLKEIIATCDAIGIFVAPSKGSNYSDTYLSTAQAVKKALENRDRPLYLLYTSSTGVYEELTHTGATENLSLTGGSEHSKILLKSEEIYLSCQNEFVTTCILRLGGIYGPNRTLEQRAIKFSGQQLPMSGNTFTNHIEQKDIIRAVKFCFDRSLAGIYNLVNDDHPTRQELYDSICSYNKIPLPIWKPDSQQGYKVANDKIKIAGFSDFSPLNNYLNR